MKLYNSRTIASVLDLTERRVRQLRVEGILPEAQRGYFALVPTVQAYINYLRNQIADRNQTSDFNTERAKLAAAKRKKQELELALMQQDAHDSEVVERIVVDMITRCRNSLLSIPSKCSPQLRELTDLNDINEMLTKHIHEALEELADFNTALLGYSEEIDEYEAELNEDIEQE